MNILDQVIRWIKRQQWARERRHRQRQLVRAMPEVASRGAKILTARKRHKRCAELMADNFNEMTDALRIEVAAERIARIAQADVARGV